MCAHVQGRDISKHSGLTSGDLRELIDCIIELKVASILVRDHSVLEDARRVNVILHTMRARVVILKQEQIEYVYMLRAE